jgi:hypothetical protein
VATQAKPGIAAGAPGFRQANRGIYLEYHSKPLTTN